MRKNFHYKIVWSRIFFFTVSTFHPSQTRKGGVCKPNMEGSLLQITPTTPNPTNQCVCLAGKQEVECKFVFNPARTSGDTQQHGLSKLANAWSPKSNVQFSVKYLICMLFMLSGRVNADSQFQRPQDRLILRPGHSVGESFQEKQIGQI